MILPTAPATSNRRLFGGWEQLSHPPIFSGDVSDSDARPVEARRNRREVHHRSDAQEREAGSAPGASGDPRVAREDEERVIYPFWSGEGNPKSCVGDLAADVPAPGHARRRSYPYTSVAPYVRDAIVVERRAGVRGRGDFRKFPTDHRKALFLVDSGEAGLGECRREGDMLGDGERTI
jgi:hypothetical protein